MTSSAKKKKNGKSGNRPARKDYLQASAASAFKKKVVDNVMLPSGVVAGLRRLGPTVILSSGSIPDSLMSIVQEALKKGGNSKEAEEKLEKDLASDPSKIAEMVNSIDEIMPKVFAEPPVLLHRRRVDAGDGTSAPLWEDIPDEQRDPEQVYTDELELQDKLFVFKYVMGGGSELETFRQQPAAGVGNVEDVAEDAVSSE